MLAHKALTLKEINIIFRNLYNLNRANQYLQGYLSSDQLYDVDELSNELIIRYHPSNGSLPITGAKLNDYH